MPVADKIIAPSSSAPAPLFDHSNALLNLAGAEALKSKESILKYAKTRMPCV